jgi:hypothetical protein
MSNGVFKGFLIAATVSFLGACGGGSVLGAGADPADPGPGTGPDPGPVAASLALLASPPQLLSSASNPANGVELIAIAKDANNNVLPGVTVTFSADSGELIVSNGTTDANGRAHAILTTGGDPENRNITVTASGGGVSAGNLVVPVIGTTLSISGPDNTQLGTATSYTATLKDASGNGIFGKTVALSTEPGNTLSATSLTTNSGGQVTVTLTPTEAASTLTAEVLGLTAVKNITVSTDQFIFLAPDADEELDINVAHPVTVSWLQGGVPVADGTVINFAATRGALSAPSATTVGGEATVDLESPISGFTFVTASSNALTKPTATRRAEFVAVTPTQISLQASPAVIPINGSSDLVTIVRDANNNLVKNEEVQFSAVDPSGGVISIPTAITDSQGVATSRFDAGSQPSPSEGVVVTAKLTSDPTIEDTALITVGQIAAGIKIGTGSQIGIKDESTYQWPFTALVTDSAGQPVQNANLSLSIKATHYLKGVFGGITAVCPNEDVDFNDIYTVAKDVNNNGVLDPGRPASITPSVTLDADGAGQFHVTYPKDQGLFVEVEITGVVTVSGTETTARRTLVLAIAEGDEDNLPGVSPYGIVGDCADPN